MLPVLDRVVCVVVEMLAIDEDEDNVDLEPEREILDDDKFEEEDEEEEDDDDDKEEKLKGLLLKKERGADLGLFRGELGSRDESGEEDREVKEIFF